MHTPGRGIAPVRRAVLATLLAMPTLAVVKTAWTVGHGTMATLSNAVTTAHKLSKGAVISLTLGVVCGAIALWIVRCHRRDQRLRTHAGEQTKSSRT